jgi:hypothetical protein
MAKPFLVVVPVVAASLTVGSVTGTTLALLQDQATVASTSLTAGTMQLTANGEVNASLPPLADLSPGIPRAVEVTFTNDSPVDAANLRMVARLVSASSSDAGVPLAFAARPLAGGETCTTAGSFASFTGGPLDLTGPMAAGASSRACLTVTLTGDLPNQQRTSAVTLTFTGQQVRG